MKKTILIILSGLLTIITICGFVISYGALLTTAVESKLEYQWGSFNTKFIWPLTVDFALITFECALFYVILFQPHLRKMMITLVVAFTGLTVYFNVIHGLPTAIPQGATEWMKAIEAGLAWSLPPVVQCLGVLVLSKIFHGIVQGKEMSPVEGVITQETISEVVEPEPPTTPEEPESVSEDESDGFGFMLGDAFEEPAPRVKKNLKSGDRKSVVTLAKENKLSAGDIAKRLNLPTNKVKEILQEDVQV